MLFKKIFLSPVFSALLIWLFSVSGFSLPILENDLVYQQVINDLDKVPNTASVDARSHVALPERVGNTDCSKLQRFARAMTVAGFGAVMIPHPTSRLMGMTAFSLAGMSYGISTIPNCENIVYHWELDTYSCSQKEKSDSIPDSKSR